MQGARERPQRAGIVSFRGIRPLSAALAVACVVAVSLYGLLLAQVAGGYLPSWSDEVQYLLEARSFAENSDLGGVFLLAGEVSRIGGFGSHGFAYGLLHGGIAKLIGFHPLGMILANAAFLIAGGLLLSRSPHLDRRQKMSTALLLLTFFMVPLYLVTFMQESLQLFFGIAASLLLIRVATRESTHATLAFLGLLLLASLFRPLWMTWSAGLIPLARDRKQALRASGLFLAAMLTSLLLQRLFSALYPYGFLAELSRTLEVGDWRGVSAAFLAHLGTNLGAFFTNRAGQPAFYVAGKFTLLGLALAMAFLGSVKRDRLARAASLICLTNFLLLFFLYDAYDWKELRTLAPLYCLCTLVLTLRGSRVLTLALLAVSIAFLPSAAGTARSWIQEKKDVAAAYAAAEDLRSSFGSIASMVGAEERPLVLVSLAFLQDSSPLLLCLPVQSDLGRTLRYTFVLDSQEFLPPPPPSVTHAISPIPDARYPFLKVAQTPYFTFFRIHE